MTLPSRFGFGKAKKKPAIKFGAAAAADDDKPKRPSPSALMGAFGAVEEVKRPSPGALMAAQGGSAAAGGKDEVDPLDAFMSDVSAEAAKPSQNKPVVEQFDEDDDIMDDYEHTDNGVRGGGDNSDDEVYAAEKTLDKRAKAEEKKKDGDGQPQKEGVRPISALPCRRGASRARHVLTGSERGAANDSLGMYTI